MPRSPAASPERSPSRGGGGRSRSRDVSPEKAPMILDTANPLYVKSLDKLSTAAFKFNKERNGIWLKTIENRELDAELFRTGLRGGMNLNLTKEEFDTVRPHWDNGGYVNGCDFILFFYRLRFEYRSRLLTERIAKEKAYRQKDANFAAARLKEIESKSVVRISFDFKPSDMQSALEKVRVAAWKFDKQGNGAANLDAFDCEYLTAENFKDVLRRTFNLKFTPGEMGAYIRHCTDDPQGKVFCASFLIGFLRTGMEERSKKLKSNWAERQRINAAAEEAEKLRLEFQEGKNAQKVSSFTEDDKKHALYKLRAAAKLYEAVSGMSMQSFEAKHMVPHEFKEQLKRVFNLKLSGPELGAIISIFDEDATGFIPCAEFAKTFLAMGFTERAMRDRNNFEAQRAADAQRKIENEEKLQALAGKNGITILDSFTEGEYSSAMGKMIEAATYFEKGGPGAPNLDAFEAKTMPAFIFKEQLRRAFHMDLTANELAAVMSVFDPKGTGEIVCIEFMQKFCRTGSEERTNKEKRWRVMQKQADERAIKHAREKQEKLDKKMLLSVASYAQEDFELAMTKLTRAATMYHKSPDDKLDAFESESLPPHVFKEQLKLAFNVKVSMPELGALMSYYDPAGKGSVHSKDFLNAFLRLGTEERDKIRKGWRDEDVQKREKDAAMDVARAEAKIQKQLSEVQFQFTEEDFDEALMIFIKICHQFEQRQLGPAGWAAFTCKSFSPIEFREVVKRTFDVRLAPRVLGALVAYFQIKVNRDDKDKRVNSQFFLQCFVQGRTSTEMFKGKKGEQDLLWEYHAKLKEEYQQRKERMGGNEDDTRPWRKTVALKRNAAGVMAMVTKKPYPHDPAEKIHRLLAVGKLSGRVDLSTKSRWPEDDETVGLVQTNNKVAHSKKKGKKDAKENKAANLAAKMKEANANAHDDALLALGDDDQRKRADFRLANIPSEIFSYQAMTELWLCNNNMGLIPSQIGEIKSLKILSLSNNNLNSFPPELCALPNLKKLLLRKNHLMDLPEAFANLTNLSELDISRNMLDVFPEVICKLDSLLTIRAGYNQLTDMPRSLVNLKSLSFLSLEANPITRPPVCFEKMQWTDVQGIVLPQSDHSAYRFKVTKEDEIELENFIKLKGAGRARRDALLRAPGRIGVQIGSTRPVHNKEAEDGNIEFRS